VLKRGAMFDCATDCTTREKLAVEVRFLDGYRPEHAFLETTHVKATDAATESAALLGVLQRANLEGVIIAFATDGASTNLGKKRGILARLGMPDYSHCVPHVAALVAGKLEVQKRANGDVSNRGIAGVNRTISTYKSVSLDMYALYQKVRAVSRGARRTRRSDFTVYFCAENKMAGSPKG